MFGYGHIQQVIAERIDDGGVAVMADALEIVLIVLMNVAVHHVARAVLFHHIQKGFEPGVRQIGVVAEAARGGMGHQDINAAAAPELEAELLNEIPEAARKATEDAKKHLVHVSMKGTSIPHETVGRFGTGEIVLLPAPEGTGVIAGGPARAVLELCGVKDIRTKSYGSNNPINMVKATIEGLASLRSAEEVAKMRGKTVEELLG